MMKQIGVYVHVPFCRQKCPYCDFYSLSGDSAVHQQYAGAVLESMEAYRGKNIKADTVYFGGGTPILPDVSVLDRILNGIRSVFDVTENAEITLEANPCLTTKEKLLALRSMGFNRISFGVQSADARELQKLGRLHTPKEAEQAVLWAQQAGFSNISIDLMLGIPGQTRESLAQTLQFVQNLSVQHVSAYLLKIEPNTAFDCETVRAELPDEDTVCDCYLECCQTLEEMGFLQYEISNFALPGKESRHNLKYWNCEEYLGFGPSAHSYFEGKRFYFERDLSAYLNRNQRHSMLEVNEIDYLEEYLIMRLRLTQGVSLTELQKRFGVDTQKLQKRCQKYLNAGFMKQNGDFLSFTRRGFLVSNSILSDLI
jgi:oxygen-independent coproporphyrinogen-3 oxidase